MSKKIALMVTGLTRTYKQTYESFHKHLLLPNHEKIDLFLCLWDHTHLRRMDYNKGQKLYEIKDKSIANIDDVLKHYNPKDYTILKTNNYTEEINSTLQYVLSKKNPPEQGKEYIRNGVISQALCWNKCLEMLGDKEYNIIVKSRFDLEHNSDIKIDIKKEDENSITCPSGPRYYGTHGFDDRFFFGDFSSMKKLLSIYNHFKNCEKLESLILEREIKSFLAKEGIKIKTKNLDVEIKR